jgi:hypothetical protein
LVEQGEQALKDQRENKKEKQKEHRREIVRNTTPIRISNTDNAKGFTLKEALRMAKEESKVHRRPVYVNVDSDGLFDMSLFFGHEKSLHCFRNGHEVQMVIPTKQELKKQKQSTINQTSEDENLDIMNTTKNKKATKKVAAKKETAPKGNAKEITVAEATKLIKAGKELWTASGKGKYNLPYLAKRHKDSAIKAIVKG